MLKWLIWIKRVVETNWYTQKKQQGWCTSSKRSSLAAHQEKDWVQVSAFDFQMHARMCPSIPERTVSQTSHYIDFKRSNTKNLLQIPPTIRKRFGRRAFCAHAPPRLWNELPDNIKAADSVQDLKIQLKTLLFRKEFIRLYGLCTSVQWIFLNVLWNNKCEKDAISNINYYYHYYRTWADTCYCHLVQYSVWPVLCTQLNMTFNSE